MSSSSFPALFLGHGNPMNAIENNDFTRTLVQLGKTLPCPRSIVCISAHWVTEGTWVTGMASPRTIHDFYGFPDKLYQVSYPAPGSPELAKRIQTLLTPTRAQIDFELWGLDHGSWSVLKHLYPEANVPVVQLSIDRNLSPEQQLEVGRRLGTLRDEGVLVLGSGNIVHNLGRIDFAPQAPALDWAVEFDEEVKSLLLRQDTSALLRAPEASPSARLSVPTREHWDPLLYVWGARRDRDKVSFDYEGIAHGSISMRCVRLQE